MRHRPVYDGIRIARANVRLATRICGTADQRGLERALDLLGAAAFELRRAEAEVGSGVPDEFGGLCRETALLKREIAVMLRAVDGCAALWRGLSMRLGCVTPGYTSHGCATAVAPSPGACELLG